MLTVYILVSSFDKTRYYIGITEDVDRRLKEHNMGDSGYSKRYAPWELETRIVFRNKSLAEQFEKYLKAGSGQAFLKRHLIPPLAK